MMWSYFCVFLKPPFFSFELFYIFTLFLSTILYSYAATCPLSFMQFTNEILQTCVFFFALLGESLSSWGIRSYSKIYYVHSYQLFSSNIARKPLYLHMHMYVCSAYVQRAYICTFKHAYFVCTENRRTLCCRLFENTCTYIQT